MSDMKTLEHAAYERICAKDLPDFRSEGAIYRHKKTGALMALVSNHDEEKVFSISFRTIPGNDTGVPHIMEHSVLCGSRKYPLKDPFLELLKGSMKTFLNAYTGPDRTAYPVASCNDRDFRNLVDVYMDAVLHPNIYKHKEIFLQEGWRYQLENKDDPLTINGVVYSEMKGAYSDPESVLSREIKRALFRDSEYADDSGGDPDVMPTLTYEDFLDFHRKYYHPGNSVIYLYGDMDMYDYLDYLDREYLCEYDFSEPFELHDQQPFGLVEKSMDYAISDDEDEEDSGYLSFGVTSTERDAIEDMAWRAVMSTLFDRPGAPVKQALIDAGLCTEVVDYDDSDLKQPMFIFYGKGADVARRDEFYEVLFREIEKELDKGLNKKALLGYLISTEFYFREQAFDSYPKGLYLSDSIVGEAMFDAKKAFDGIGFIDACRTLRDRVDTGYFEQLARRILLSHKHEVRLTMVPKKGINKAKEEQLAKQLENYKASLSEAEIARLVKQTADLKAYQEKPETPEALATIPLLDRSDLRREVMKYPLEKTEINGIPVLHYDTELDGITYIQTMIDVTDLPKEELPYLGLFGTLLLDMDTKKHSYAELNDELWLHVGDLFSSVYGSIPESKTGRFKGIIKHALKSLTEELPAALEFLREMVADTDFSDKKRLLELIREKRSGMRSSAMYSGNVAAYKRCMSYFVPADYFVQETNRLGQYRFLCDCEDHFEERADEIIRHLNGILAYTLQKKRLTIGVFATPKDFEEAKKLLPDLIDQWKAPDGYEAPEPATVMPWEGGYPLSRKNEAFTFSSQVNYVCAAGSFTDAGYKKSGSLAVLQTLLSKEYLWQNVRVKGGAYGCSIVINGSTGAVALTSYRDPSIGRTYDVYRAIPEYLRSLDLTERELTKYVIGTISNSDRPMSPLAKGETAVSQYMAKTSDKSRQKRRNSILDVTLEDLKKHADMIEAVLSQGYVCCFGSEQAIEKEKELFLQVEPL